VSAADLSPSVVWGLFVVVGAITFAIRYSFIYLFGRIDELPPRVAAALRYVPPAVLAALVAPSLVGGGPADPLLTARTLAGGVAVVVAWYTESAVATIAAGMAALWLAEWAV
jgi:branched-subunit amino acid transport protein